MGRDISLLDSVRIASPCHVPWDSMRGDDRVRFCDKCQLSVYNLTMMMPDEAERFLVEREGRACVRAYRRTDGTILTQNCPWAVRMARRAAARVLGAAALILLFIAQIGSRVLDSRTSTYDIGTIEPFSRFRNQAASLQQTSNVLQQHSNRGYVDGGVLVP